MCSILCLFMYSLLFNLISFWWGMCVLGEGGVYVQLQTNKCFKKRRITRIRVYTVNKYFKYQTLRFVQDEIDEMGTTVIYQSSRLY